MPTAASSTLQGSPCGLDCAQYDSPRAAFAEVLTNLPTVLAIGEAHAPKGTVDASSAKRFADELLPLLAGRASDLLVELMMPPRSCVDAAAEVRTKQQPATSRQAETNQNEYVSMGEKARTLAIVPDMLRPTCADMDAVRDAGDAIDASLQMIARLSVSQAERLLDRDAQSEADRGKAVVLYGGMLHNELSPSPERASWSYAPALDAYVHGRLVAIDLVVPEIISATTTPGARSRGGRATTERRWARRRLFCVPASEASSSCSRRRRLVLCAFFPRSSGFGPQASSQRGALRSIQLKRDTFSGKVDVGRVERDRFFISLAPS